MVLCCKLNFSKIPACVPILSKKEADKVEATKLNNLKLMNLSAAAFCSDSDSSSEGSKVEATS